MQDGALEADGLRDLGVVVTDLARQALVLRLQLPGLWLEDVRWLSRLRRV